MPLRNLNRRQLLALGSAAAGLAALVIGLAGYRLGMLRGERLADERLTFLYQPTNDIRTVSGVLEAKENGVWIIDIPSLLEPIPEARGAPRKRERRRVILTSKTALAEIDLRIPPAPNAPLAKTAISPAQFLVGDAITVLAERNIAAEKEFEASEIQRIIPPPESLR